MPRMKSVTRRRSEAAKQAWAKRKEKKIAETQVTAPPVTADHRYTLWRRELNAKTWAALMDAKEQIAVLQGAVDLQLSFFEGLSVACRLPEIQPPIYHHGGSTKPQTQMVLNEVEAALEEIRTSPDPG